MSPRVAGRQAAGRPAGHVKLEHRARGLATAFGDGDEPAAARPAVALEAPPPPSFPPCLVTLSSSLPPPNLRIVAPSECRPIPPLCSVDSLRSALMTPTASCTLITLEHGPRDLSAGPPASQAAPPEHPKATRNLARSRSSPCLPRQLRRASVSIEPFKASPFTSSKPGILSLAAMGTRWPWSLAVEVMRLGPRPSVCSDSALHPSGSEAQLPWHFATPPHFLLAGLGHHPLQTDDLRDSKRPRSSKK